MPETSRIRWTSATWNPMSGCTQVSPGCANCYALELAERMRGSPAFPVGFDPVYKPWMLKLPGKWREGRRIFVNSMSDLFHEAFTEEQLDTVFEVMATVTRHTYQVLTKRPERMAEYVNGTPGHPGWLERRGLVEVPPHIWLGATIESNRYVYRADVLRTIPVPVRFISAEPLIDHVDDLDLTGIGWIIVGGESGPAHRQCCRGPAEDRTPGRRCIDHAWARTILDKAREAGTAYFFKQDGGSRTETRPWLVMADGSHLIIEEYPDDPAGPEHAAGLLAPQTVETLGLLP